MTAHAMTEAEQREWDRRIEEGSAIRFTLPPGGTVAVVIVDGKPQFVPVDSEASE